MKKATKKVGRKKKKTSRKKKTKKKAGPIIEEEGPVLEIGSSVSVRLGETVHNLTITQITETETDIDQEEGAADVELSPIESPDLLIIASQRIGKYTVTEDDRSADTLGLAHRHELSDHLDSLELS